MTTAAMVGGLLLAASSSSSATVCVLPVPDGQVEAPSAHNYEGVITGVSEYRLTMTPTVRKGVKVTPVTLLLTEATQIFTVYGGYVAREKLQAGQRARIWLEKCGQSNEAARGRVAVVQLASTRPGHEFP
jgi:hypothetical protein